MDRIQDQRPVFMGTFSKYTKAFDSRVALMENDVESHKKMLKRYYNKLDRVEKLVYTSLVITAGSIVAILMLGIFG